VAPQPSLFPLSRHSRPVKQRFTNNAGSRSEDWQVLLRKRLNEKDEGKPPAVKASRTLMRELLDDLLVYYKNNGRRSTSILEKKLDQFLKPFFGQLRASDVTSAEIDRYIAFRKAGRIRKGKKIPCVKNATINRELSSLKLAFRLGSDAGKVLRIPKIEKLEEAPPREGFFEDTEYQSIRRHLPDHTRPITDVARITGMRKGELLSLTWGRSTSRQEESTCEPWIQRRSRRGSFQ
jgi:integrase